MFKRTASSVNPPARAEWVKSLRLVLPERPGDVLDLATGSGFLALIAAGLGHRVTAVDLAGRMLDVARAAAEARGLDVVFLHGDAVAPDFPDGSFDVVTCRHLLWTLRDADTAARNWR